MGESLQVEEPWYVSNFGPAFQNLLSGSLAAFLSQSLVFELAGGVLLEGILVDVNSGENVTVAFPQFTPREALPQGVLIRNARAVVQLSSLTVVRLPQGASVPRALAECARKRQVKFSKLNAEGKRAPGGGSALSRAPAAEAAPLGLSWCLYQYSGLELSL